MMHFDEAHLVKELENRPVWARLAFAAASASRLFPSYKKFCEETKLSYHNELSECLNAVWLYALTLDNKICQCVSLVERSLKLIPDESMASLPYFTVAEHAATAVVYTLRVMLTGEAQEAAWAARHVYEAIDDFVLSTNNIDLNAPGAEDKILSDQLIQKELGRQRRDLEDTIGKTEIDARNVILQLRERSEKESALPS